MLFKAWSTLVVLIRITLNTCFILTFFQLRTNTTSWKPNIHLYGFSLLWIFRCILTHKRRWSFSVLQHINFDKLLYNFQIYHAILSIWFFNYMNSSVSFHVTFKGFLLVWTISLILYIHWMFCYTIIPSPCDNSSSLFHLQTLTTMLIFHQYVSGQFSKTFLCRTTFLFMSPWFCI